MTAVDQRAIAEPDGLLRPSLQDAHLPGTHGPRRPWRVGSQFFVAFFGGILPGALIAYLNGRRLGLLGRVPNAELRPLRDPSGLRVQRPRVPGGGLLRSLSQGGDPMPHGQVLTSSSLARSSFG